jgi:hypothetical protein
VAAVAGSLAYHLRPTFATAPYGMVLLPTSLHSVVNHVDRHGLDAVSR